MSRTNYIFVDCENIQQIAIDLIEQQPVVVSLVLGKQTQNLPIELVEKLLKHSSQVRLIKTKLTGKNALDFVLAYLVGRQAVEDPAGYFHIVSRDKGFDALIQHLKDGGIFAARHDEFAKIPILQKEAQPLDERVLTLIAHFAKNPTNRPKKESTLRSHVHTHFGKKLSAAELDSTIKTLTERKVIQITAAGAVSYKG